MALHPTGESAPSPLPPGGGGDNNLALRPPITKKLGGGSGPEASVPHGRRSYRREFRRGGDPSPPGFFEFVDVLGSELHTDDEIFLRDPLLPYKPLPAAAVAPVPPRTPHRGQGRKAGPTNDENRRPARHRGYDPTYGDERPRSGGGGGGATRYRKGKSGGLNVVYQRLPTVPEACEGPAAARGGHAPPRPNWYVLVFGSVPLPAEMDMRDIRSRLRRRGTPGDSGPTGPGAGRGGTWKLLRSLSCHGDVNAVLGPPFPSGLT